MAARILICFPISEAPGLRNEALQLAIGLAARGDEVLVFGPLGPWRHALRLSGVTAHEFNLPAEERKFIRAIQDKEPQIIHAFGAEAAHLALPLTLLIGAGGVATLGHADLPRLIPTNLRTASAIFVPCEHLREQVARRLPGTPVVPTGYLLPPPSRAAEPQLRFLADELGLRDGAPVVLMADYFRNSETESAKALIAAVPTIAQRVPNVQVVIAGTGIRLGELEEAAYEVNDELGYRAVLLPGHRDDLPQLLSLATVAVGSGRFAAEALAAGVALVAAGHAGLVGTVTDETAKVAHFTCFGRHGHLDPITPKALASEIVGLFTYEQYREQFAAEGQRRILAESEREHRAAQIATYYTRTAPNGIGVRTPQRLTAVLPDDLRGMLFCLPAIGALKAQFPLAKITLAAQADHAGLLRQLDAADSVLEKPKHLTAWLPFLRELRGARPDIALCFAEDTSSTVIAGCSRAPHRLGFAEVGGSILLTDHLHARAAASPAKSLMLVHGLGIANGAPLPAFPIPEEVREAAELSLLGAGVEAHERVILLCPRAGEDQAWPQASWADLARQLAEDRPERIVVLGEGEFDLPAGVVAIPQPEDALHLAALLARAMTVVAPDNDALHLADLLGVPTVGLYGPTTPEAVSLPNELRVHLTLPATPAKIAAAVAECCPLELELAS